MTLPGQRSVSPQSPTGRRWLRAVPSQKTSPDPLLLGEAMRLRLQTAVRALLEDESVAGLPDVARAAAVVLFAKGGVKRAHVRTWSGELGRWLGVGVSTISHRVLPPLRAKGAIKTWVETDDDGHPVALDIVLQPVWQVRRAKDRSHPLALTKRELATLLRLVEALFGPGWEPKNKPATPAGRLAERRGPGAATERLALLQLVLSCRETGWLRLTPGTLRFPDLGRGAATLAHLMLDESSVADSWRTLGRLEAGGLVAMERDGDGELTGRVRLLPVAERHAAVRSAGKRAPGKTSCRGERQGMRLVQPAPASACQGPEDVQEPSAASSSVEHSADGDLERPEPLPEQVAGLLPAETSAQEAASAANSGADLHTLHASGGAVGGSVDVVAGFSGARAVVVGPRRPERAGAREDVADPAVPELCLVVAGDGPLRGEQPGPIEHHQPRQKPTGVRPKPIVSLPQDGYLARALAPAEELWQRLENPSTRGFLLKHVRAALADIAAWTGEDDAPETLADRLSYRLKRQRQQGNPNVDSPVAWFLERGLPQEQQCVNDACDNGVRLDSQSDCTTCDLRVEDRRSSRRVVIRQVVQQLPDTPFEERQDAIEDALRGHANLRTEARADAARRKAESEARWEAERPQREALAAEAERARLAVPCADCGAEQARGLCRGCARGRELAEVGRECVSVALATWADLDDEAAVQAVRERTLEHLVSTREFARRGAVDDLIEGASQIAELVAVKRLLADYRQLGVEQFAGSEQARAEADAAYEAVMRAAHRRGGVEAAERKAVSDAEQALDRAARWLLEQRIAVVEQRRAQAEPQPAVLVEAGRDAVGADRVRAAVNQRMVEDLDRALVAAGREYVDLALAVRADLSDGASVREVWEQAREEVRQARAESGTGAAGVLAVRAELSAVRKMIVECRETALGWFEGTESAQAQGQAEFDTALGLRRSHESEAVAEARALRAANATCQRAAEEFLARRIARVERMHKRAAAARTAGADE